MSDDQIATALGQIMGQLHSLDTRVRDYMESHDSRHAVIDEEIKDHAAQINQAKGAKAAVLLMATAVSGVVGVAVAYIGKVFK